MKAKQYLERLTAAGQISFLREQMQRDLKLTPNAVACTLRRLKQQGYIVSPARGYYLIIPPEFLNLGCLPPDFFIDDLMKYLQMNYYVALLSAALYHGVAHQQPQIFQVMIPTVHTAIQCGRARIQFVKNQSLHDNPIVKLKTRIGFMRVATPETTAKDLLNFISQSGGIGQIATVIDELAESLEVDKLLKLAKQNQQPQWIQRLGYILETLEHGMLAESLFQIIKNKKLRIIPLVPNRGMTGMPRDEKWRIAKNATIESDIK